MVDRDSETKAGEELNQNSDAGGPRSRPNLADPYWFLDHLDLETGQARFVRADRATLSAQPFLDPRWDRSRRGSAAMPGADLDRTETAPVPLHFIWHTSFCCSTVIAALLDQPGRCLALKEPRALVDLADLKRRQQGLKRPGLTSALFGLYARRFEPDEQILIKPSNFANNLIVEAATLSDGRMLMVYSSCRSFLISILKAGEARRGYVRQLFISLAADGHPQAQWPLTTLLGLSDLHMAAIVWHMQMATIQSAMTMLGQRAASLDGDAFLHRPREALEALDGFFDLKLGSDELDRRASAPSLGRDVKTGAPGAGLDRRVAEARDVERTLAVHLDSLVAWASQASPDVRQTLPRALI
jgi:hypothetical protein